jgi:hypothetical protein
MVMAGLGWLLHASAADPLPGNVNTKGTSAETNVLSGLSSRSQSAAPGNAAPPRLQVSSVAQTIPGGRKIPALIAVAETTRFSFLPPSGWRVQTDTTRKQVRLVQPETGALITMDIIEEKTKDLAPLGADDFKKRLLARFANGKILDEFTVSALGQAGPAFDLEWRTEHNLRQLARAAFIPFPEGRLEFCLTGTANTLSRQQHDFNRLLLSLRSAPLDGKLAIQPVTPE